MEHRVGSNTPPPATTGPLLSQAQSLKSELEKFCITHTPDERSSRLKPLRGAEAKIRKAADLCERYGVSIRAIPVQGMLDDLDLCTLLAPFVAALGSAAQMVEDTQNQAFSEAWQAYLALYGALSKAAEHDPTLAAEMTELFDFMAIYGAKRKGTKPATAPATPNTPPKTP